jgi:hypothetical protein
VRGRIKDRNSVTVGLSQRKESNPNTYLPG